MKNDSGLKINALKNTGIRERILVIDDEKRICDSLRTLLSGSGYDVAAFESSQEAADEIRTGRFDLIVSDIKMPGLTGLDLLRLARSVDPQALVVLMTGFGSLESAIEAINQGVYDYLIKPVEFPQLELVIKRGLEKRRLGRAKSFLLTELQEKNQELQNLLSEINALYEASKSIGSTLKLDQLLSTIIKLAAGVLHVKIGSIMLLDETRNYLTIAAAIGLEDDVIRSTRLPIGSSISGYVAKNGEPLFVSNVEDDARFQRENREERYGPASLLSVPLMVKKRVIGVINVAHKATGGEFVEHDLKLLTTFASQAAVAIDNASTVHQLKRRVLELSTLQEIADAMSRAGSAQNLQEIIHWGINNLMPAESTLWFRWNDREKSLVFSGAGGARKIDLEISIATEFETVCDQEKVKELILNHLLSLKEPAIQTSSFNAFPIFGASGLAYVFCLASSVANCFNEEDEKIAFLIASQAASMYEREKAILNATRLLTMGNMISEISHDLRRPLTSIRGSLQIIRSRWPELAEQSDLFRNAEEEVHHLNELVRELVDFSNPKKYQTEKVDISKIISRTLHLVKSDMEDNNISCQTDFEEELPQIFVNRNQIMEVFLNLIMNAIEAIGSDGGTISLRAETMTSNGTPRLRIEVSDTGCGIDEKDKAAIFARYYTTKETGTGLGLAVVERIISAHNGQLEVKSTKGEGTTFIIHLPY